MYTPLATQQVCICLFALFFISVVSTHSRGMLQRSDRIEDADEMLWELSLVLLLAWILTYVCVVQGIKSSGKVVLTI